MKELFHSRKETGAMDQRKKLELFQDTEQKINVCLAILWV